MQAIRSSLPIGNIFKAAAMPAMTVIQSHNLRKPTEDCGFVVEMPCRRNSHNLNLFNRGREE
jgi:hypothetical protein